MTEELSHQEGTETRHETGKHDPPVSIHPSQFVGHDIPGNHKHLGRNHHGGKDKEKYESFAGEPVFAQGETDERVEEQYGEGDSQTDNHGIGEPPGEVAVAQQFGIIQHGGMLRHQREVENIRTLFETGGEHPDEGEQHGHAEEREDQWSDVVYGGSIILHFS